MYQLIQHNLEQLPGAIKEEQLPDGSTIRRCLYTPHSLRATTAIRADVHFQLAARAGLGQS